MAEEKIFNPKKGVVFELVGDTKYSITTVLGLS